MSLNQVTVAVTGELVQLLIREEQQGSTENSDYARISNALLSIYESLTADDETVSSGEKIRLIRLLAQLEWLCEVRHRINPSPSTLLSYFFILECRC